MKLYLVKLDYGFGLEAVLYVDSNSESLRSRLIQYEDCIYIESIRLVDEVEGYDIKLEKL
jgi:hypothetical protein